MTRLVLLPLLCLTVSACAPKDVQTALDRYVGRDLRYVRPSRIKPLLESIGEQKDYHFFGTSPWYIWRTGKGAATRYIVFEGQNGLLIPGGSSAKIHLLDGAALNINTWSFSTGWRIGIDDANFSRVDELVSDVITIETTGYTHGLDVAKQYFAFSGDDLRFIRMENSKGRLIRNNYASPREALGVGIEGIGRKRWLALLRSANPVDVLAALTFLGGSHIDSEKRSEYYKAEDAGQARLFQELRASQEVVELLDQYLRSDSTWLRDAARLAVRGDEDQSPSNNRVFDIQLNPSPLDEYYR